MRTFVKILLALILTMLMCYLAWTGFIREQVDLYRYPLKYTDIVNKYSEKYEIPPEILYAVIKTESNFHEKAVSHAGAKGLMQLMDETNNWVAALLREEVLADDTFTPDTNIRRGTYLLSYLKSKYNGWPEALAAYNAGIGRVNGWLENPEYSSDGITLDRIPFSETAEYVKRVLSAEKKYSKLYFE